MSMGQPSALTLVLMAGAPGAGKSTLALAIGRALGWPVVDKDTLKSALLEAGTTDARAGPLSYDLMFEVGRDVLVRQRQSVILDSPAAYPRCVERATQIAAEAGGRLRVVCCVADDAVRAARLGTRRTLRSQLTAGTFQSGSERFAHLPGDALTLDSARPLADLLSEALAYIGAM
jgi:predicted kinase